MALSGLYSAGGAGWYLAKSLQKLADEVSVQFPRCTCQGTKGNPEHEAEGYDSDHNAFIDAPNGLGVVRAIDIAGPLEDLTAIETRINALYNARDLRVYPFGYTHMNNEVTTWDSNPATTLHYDAGDAGHLHVSVTQRDGNNPSPAGYVAAIDSTDTWGLGPAANPNSQPEDDAMKFRLIRRTATGEWIAYNNTGMWWHVPDPGWVAELQADQDCLSSGDVDDARFSAIAAMADSCIMGPNGQLKTVVDALPTIMAGVNNATTAANNAVAAIGAHQGAAVDLSEVPASIADELGRRLTAKPA